MIRTHFAFLFALSAISSIGLTAAQTAPPGAQTQNTAPASRNRAADPANRGRFELDQFLDGIATQDAASRATAVAAIHTRQQAEARQAKVRSQILALIGAFPERTPLNAKVLGETQAEGFRIRKIIFESQPNFFVTALLYVSDGDAPGGKRGAPGGGSSSPGSKRAAILMTPGHGATGKAGDAPVAATFARNGFIVLSYDPIGQGERLQYPDPAKPGATLARAATGEHGEASLQPMLIGETFAKYEIWDAMRGVDYLESLPEVDPHRIGAVGCSGGGTVTALTSALDTRIAATGTACYITSFDALLPTLGPQDAEQSTPRFISSGLGFPDWVELAAPRAYAVLSTYSDMFPFAGARESVIEARRFYALFDPASAGTPVSNAGPSVPPTPTVPAVNSDTTNHVSPNAKLQWITGPGGHGALQPIMGDIVSFFLRNLQPGADADHPFVPSANGPRAGMALIANIPKDAFQVTTTGQVATSFPGCASVFTLNKKRAARIVPAHRPLIAFAALGTLIRDTTGAAAQPGKTKFAVDVLSAKSGPVAFPSEGNLDLEADLAVPTGAGRHPAVLLVVPNSIHGSDPIARANKTKFDALAAQGNLVLAITPRPSPPGADDMKASVLGPFYLLSLRADLVGRTLVGLRTDDVIRAIDYLSSRADVDPARISAQASGHMGLVLLHAGVLDRRIRHIDVNHVLSSYRSLLDAPLPTGAPEDVIPGVLLHYDIPDLERALKPRLTESDPLQGTNDLSQDSTPLASLTGATP
ncbi:MAG: acetylxylan esterase [Terracidiphilus sp.]|nr:acetylxylan esterase [Terracidiphilus sp.]MDR3798115.1 acetylxylan esterase [Terracidiphilus sp.]